MPRPQSVSNYTVKSGDTLAGIGRKFGVSVQAIVDANGIPDPNKIRVGVVLGIPAAASLLEEFTPTVSRTPVTIDNATGQPVPEVLITAPRTVATPAFDLSDWLRPPKVYLGAAIVIGAFILLSSSRGRRYED